MKISFVLTPLAYAYNTMPRTSITASRPCKTLGGRVYMRIIYIIHYIVVPTKRFIIDYYIHIYLKTMRNTTVATTERSSGSLWGETREQQRQQFNHHGTSV